MARGAWQSVGFDGLLYLLGNLAVLRKVTVADEGSVTEVVWLNRIRLHESAAQTKGRIIWDFTVAVLAVHRSIIPSLRQCVRESVEVACPLGNGTCFRPYNEHHVIRERGR